MLWKLSISSPSGYRLTTAGQSIHSCSSALSISVCHHTPFIVESLSHPTPEATLFMFLTLLRQQTFATFACNGGRVNLPSDIFRVLEHIATKFQRIHHIFGVKLSSSCTLISRNVGVCVLEIHDGKQITGNTNNSVGFTHTCRFRNNTWVCDYVRNIKISSSHGRRYLVTKRQPTNQK